MFVRKSIQHPLIIDGATGAAVLVLESKTYGMFRVLIDLDDWGRVSPLSWCVARDHRAFYFHTQLPNPNGGYKTTRLHRFIMNITDPTVVVDHINNNHCDNRKLQLQAISNRHNVQKKRAVLGGASRYRGVSRYRGSWRAVIETGGKQWSSGRLDTEEMAAFAYDAKARELNTQGHSFSLNFPVQGEYAA